MLKQKLQFSTTLLIKLTSNKTIVRLPYPARSFSEWKFRKTEEKNQPTQQEERRPEEDPENISRSVTDPALIDKYIEQHQNKTMPSLWTMMILDLVLSLCLFAFTTSRMLKKYRKVEDLDDDQKMAEEEDIYNEMQLVTAKMKDDMEKKKQDVLESQQKKAEQIKSMIVEKKDNRAEIKQIKGKNAETQDDVRQVKTNDSIKEDTTVQKEESQKDEASN